MLEILSPLLVILINCIVHSKDILWVHTFLDAFEHIIVELRVGQLHKSLSEFTDAMMVRDAAPILENCLPGAVFDILVNVYDFFDGIFIVVDGEVDIDGGTSLVELGHSEAYKHFISLLAV